ncbi:MAG: tetratricopeptide repeat protein [Anaerolineales bacterium]|jgi:tetratricopeptide (TPR) repeat protein
MVTDLGLLQRLGDVLHSPSVTGAARRLRQEPGLWQALHEESFLESCLRMAGEDPARYRPAVLGLLKAGEAEAVRYALEPESARAGRRLSADLQARARAAMETLAKGMPGDIPEFALAALSMATSPDPAEQLSQMGEAGPRALIYLLGLVSGGAATGSVLARLLPAQPKPVIHALLANLEGESLDQTLGSWIPLLRSEQTIALLEAAHDLGEPDLERRIAAVLSARPASPSRSASPSDPSGEARRDDLATLLAARVGQAMGSEETYRENLKHVVETAKLRAAVFTSELADDALQRNDPVTALAAFRELMELLPASRQARAGTTRALLRLHRLEEALQLMPTNPQEPEDWLTLAQLQSAQDNGSLARQFARQVSPSERCSVSSGLLIDTARSLAAQGAYQEASEIQETIVDRRPSNPEALLDLAKYQGAAGNWDAARGHALLAWTLDPSRPSALQVVAQGHEMLGAVREAQNCWRRLVQDQPGDSEALQHLAQTSLQLGDSGQARDAAQQLLTLRPDSGEARALLGAAMLAEGDLSSAQATLQEATQFSPSSALAWKTLAELHEKRGDLESAATALRTGIESASQPDELLLALGKLALRRGLLSEAAAALQRVVALRPKDPGYLQPFSQALMRLGRTAEAEQALRAALEVSPADVDLILALDDLLEAGRRLEEGRDIVQSALQLRPDSTALPLRLGRILISLYHEGGDGDPSLLKQGIDLLQRALEPGAELPDSSALTLLGQALLLDGQPGEALAAFTRAIPLPGDTPTPSAREAHLGAAQAFLQFSDSASALTHVRLALQTAPDDPLCLQMLAQACEAAGSLEEAREAFQRLLVLVPAEPEALRGLALVLRKLGQTEQAVQLLQQAAQLAPSQARGWADLAETLAANQQVDQARQAMAQAIAAASPRDREIPLRAAQFLMELKEYAEADQLLREALRLNPADVRTLDTLGQALLRSGQFEESIEAFTKAADLDPANPDRWDHAAEAYWQNGRREGAIALWKKAIGLGPKGQALTARLAGALLSTGEYGEAARYFEKAVATDPANPALLAAASRAALRSGDHAKASAWVQQAIEADPGSLEARRLEAQIALESGAPDEALRISSQLVSEAPEDGICWALLAKSHARLGAPAPAAVGLQHPALLAMQKALAKCESSREAMSVTAEAAMLVEDYPAAIRLLEGLVQADPDAADYPLRLAEALTARAEAYFRWHTVHAADGPEWTEAVSPAAEQAARAALAQAGARGASQQVLSTLAAQIRLAFAHPEAQEMGDLQHLVAEISSAPAMISLSQAQLRMGNPSQAIRWASQAAALDPRNPAACLALALSQWKMGKSDDALQSLIRASELASFLALPHALAALIHAGGGNMDQATGSLQKAVALAPQVSSWEHLLGQWLGAAGELEASIAHYQRAAEISPQVEDYQISLARALRRDGDLRGAHRHYRQALSLSPEPSAQLLAEAGELALEAGSPQEAAQDLRKALETSSPTPPVEWGLWLARALIGTGHRADARKLVEKAGADPRYQGQSLAILAEIEESEEHLDRAAELLAQAISILPDPFPETLHLAQLWTLSGKPERAVETLLAAEPAHPNSDLLSHSLAEALLKLGKGEEALQRAQTAAELTPRRGDHWLLVGRVARKLGQIDQALDAVRRARELDPKDWRADMELGLALEAQQRWDLALEAYRAAARLSPTNSEVMYRMGVVLKNLRSYSEATEALRQAVRLNPNNLPAHKLLSAVMALGLVYGLPELAPDKR